MTWVILYTMPSGEQYVCGPDEQDKLMLHPVILSQRNDLQKVFLFDSESLAQAWIDATAKLSPQAEILMSRCTPMQGQPIQ